jgi:DNA mismatch endonuclease (patch repair protein)
MTDSLTRKRRSWNMSRIRSRDTTPEKIVRSVVHRMGYRFRLHARNLPGTPDLVLPKRSVAIFVHGCFWHQHRNCPDCSRPRTNRQYWVPKLDGNVRRDSVSQRCLRRLGWKVIVIWDCQTKNLPRLEARLSRLLQKDVS